MADATKAASACGQTLAEGAEHRGRVAAGNAAARHVRLPLPGPSALARTAGRRRAAEADVPFPDERIRPQNQAPDPPRLHARTAGRSRAAEADAPFPGERIQPQNQAPGPPRLHARTAGRSRAAEADALLPGERIRPQNRVPGPPRWHAQPADAGRRKRTPRFPANASGRRTESRAPCSAAHAGGVSAGIWRKRPKFFTQN